MLVAGGDAILIGFGVCKIALALQPEKYRPGDEPPGPTVCFRIAMAMLLRIVLLGVVIGWLSPVVVE